MKLKLDIPDHISIEQYQKLQNLEHLTDLAKTIETISIITGFEADVIKSWNTDVLPKIYGDVVKVLDIKENFYPIFKFEDQLYGFQPIDKMLLGEYVDLENLCKDPVGNLHEIMALFYRPIKSHNFTNFIFKAAHKFLIAKNKVVNVFKHYKLEKYDNESRTAAADKLREMPIQYALGALGFFLGNVSGYLTSIMPSSTPAEANLKETMEMTNLLHLVNIGVGLGHFIRSPKQVYSISQEKKVLLT